MGEREPPLHSLPLTLTRPSQAPPPPLFAPHTPHPSDLALLLPATVGTDQAHPPPHCPPLCAPPWALHPT